MKKIIIIVFVLFSMNNKTTAQITELVIGVDGFTCSLCAKGVEEQFKSLDFVKSVKTDLKSTTFDLSFKSSPKINVIEIRDAVEDGGFSLRDIKVEAKGTIKGNSSSGYYLSTPNAPDLKLTDLKQEYNEGEKLLIKGMFLPASNTVKVTSAKKI